MSDKPVAARVVGLNLEDGSLQVAVVSEESGKIEILSTSENEATKPLDLTLNEELIASAVESKVALVRSLSLPVKGRAQIASVLSFQAEPLLPFPVEEALLDWQLLQQKEEKSKISLLAVRKEHLEEHLKTLPVDPEGVTTTPAALAQFAHYSAPTNKLRLLLHISSSSAIVVLVDNEKLLSSHHIAAGAKAKELPQKVQQALLSSKKGIKQEIEEEIILTGIPEEEKLLNLKTIVPEHASFAISVGIALSFLSSTAEPLNFRKNELAYATPFRRYQKPALQYIALSFFLSALLWLAGNQWLDNKEGALQEEYYSLLTVLNKTPELVDQEYEKKNRKPAPLLNANGIKQRAQQLEDELTRQADTFPLRPNLPLVSDLLAWYASNPEVVENNRAMISLHSFYYTMTRRPDATNKRQRYQVRVEIEFTSETPRHAREFHDALIAPNPFVDPKSDVKWSSAQGRYKATFFLKDRTAYLSAFYTNKKGTHYVA